MQKIKFMTARFGSSMVDFRQDHGFFSEKVRKSSVHRFIVTASFLSYLIFYSF